MSKEATYKQKEKALEVKLAESGFVTNSTGINNKVMTAVKKRSPIPQAARKQPQPTA